MSKNNYIIDNLEEFAESSRRFVFLYFGENKPEIESKQDMFISSLTSEEEEELNNILPLNEAKNIVKSIAKIQKHKISKEERYIINDKIFIDILEALNMRLVSNILISLSNRGMIESAYDNTLDDFVFWVKNDNDNNEKKS